MNVYDFDDTIYDGDSTKDFYFYLLKKNKKLLLLIPSQTISFIKYSLKIISKEKFKESFYKAFSQFDNIDYQIQSFWNKNKAKIKKWYLEEHEKEDLVISASPYFLLKPILSEIGVTNLIASDVDKNAGKYLSLNCYGEEKVRKFNYYFKNKKIAKFFTDSLSDLPLIKISKESFIVRGSNIINYKEYKESFFSKIKRFFLEPDFLLFVFCGGVGTLSNFVVALVVSRFLNPTLSYVIGYSLSLFITYFLNIKLIFLKKYNTREFFKFVISYIPNFIILFTFVAVFLNVFGWNKIIVYALAGLLGIPITYILVKLFALKNKVEYENKN